MVNKQAQIQAQTPQSHWQLSLGAFVAIAVSLGATQIASAQTTNAPPLVGTQNESNDPFSNRGGNQSTGVFDIIHRAMQGGSVSSDDFRTQQKDNLDSATADFRAQQQERLRKQQQQQATSETPATPAANK